ncbi:MAG: rRNA pseudouridine synthase [Clostridiales bacterium]|nr:rRNA pseudouridine synthase [Clostridiales bacterium]
MRLDKYLALSGERTRSEATRLIRSGAVEVNCAIVKDGAFHISETDEIRLLGQVISDSGNQYLMLFKPAGVLTAARDKHASTVMDLVPERYVRRKVLPVGRLDKDTTGLLLLTNDGELAHRLLSPKRHVTKTYLATVTGRLDESDVAAFEAGIELSDFVSMPAGLTILSAEGDESRALVELREGKFHQVKRMFLARGHEVITLHRPTFGPLQLDETLKPGDSRELTQEEVTALRKCAGLLDGKEDSHG